MKKLFYFFIILILGLFVLVAPTFAITQTAGEMTINHDEPLFPSSTVWYPGLSLRNTIEVKNTGGSIRGLGINSTNTSHTGGMADVLILKVDDGGHYVFGGNGDKTMKDFWNEGDFEVANLGPYETKTIGFTVGMPGSRGNEYQGKEAKFDIIIGFLDQSSVIFTAAAGGGGGTTSTSPATGAVLGAVSNPFTDFFGPFEEVLGESTSSADITPTPSPEVIGIGQVEGASIKNLRKFIVPLVSLALLFLLILYFYKKRKNSSS